MRVLIVPDKFKGTLRAAEAASAIARGWRQVRPEDDLQSLPMSDGGDGFGEIIGRLLGAGEQRSATVDAAHKAVQVSWWWSGTQHTAIVESAAVIGLAMLPPGAFHPFDLDTLGLGRLLAEIADLHQGCRLILGIGGSATNDAGFGMALGLGFQFEGPNNSRILQWTGLEHLERIQPPAQAPDFAEVIIASDVRNPLPGPQGATRVYGPQKGMRPEDFPLAERCFARLEEIVRCDLGKACAEDPGAGAAGGLGYGLRVFLNGRFQSGFEVFAEKADLRRQISEADLIVTAEGAIDEQSEMGKGTGAIAQLARAEGKRCIGLAAVTPGEKPSSTLFDILLRIAPELTDVASAKKEPARWLAELARIAAERV